jgi:hypothetical protein
MATPSSEKLEARRREYLVVIIAFAASGASSLMLKAVWTRMMGWLLGATTW